MKTPPIKYLKAIYFIAILSLSWLICMAKNGVIYFLVIAVLILIFTLIYQIVNDK
jgi:hypothetical protein